MNEGDAEKSFWIWFRCVKDDNPGDYINKYWKLAQKYSTNIEALSAAMSNKKVFDKQCQEEGYDRSDIMQALGPLEAHERGLSK